MDKKKAKELIEGYKSNGFNHVDIALNNKRIIQVALENDLCRYGSHFLKIMNGDLSICIRYSIIESIAV